MFEQAKMVKTAAMQTTQAQNNRTNFQPCHQHKDSKIIDEKEREDLLKPGDTVKNRWRILGKIGGGGFGEIYQAIDTQVDPEKISQGSFDVSELCSSCSAKIGNHVQRHVSAVAITMSESSFRLQHCSGCGQQNLSENSVKTDLNLRTQEIPQFTQSVVWGQITMLSRAKKLLRPPDLWQNPTNQLCCHDTSGQKPQRATQKAPNRSFTRSTALRIICKCLDALEELHSIGYLHRDIKPSNFCLRRDNAMEICLLDFGLVRPYTKPGTTNQIRPPRPSAGFRGTVRYASTNAHEYRELGRHDDLWSMYYMLVEFLSGELPWQRRSEKSVVKQMKLETEPANLGIKGGLPQTIATTWVHELKNLDYYTTPSYRELRKVIEVWLSENRVEWNDPYDWQKQSMMRAESETTFTPLFKRNQASRHQFAQNAKRLAQHDSMGCLRRLDKRGFGSNVELKRLESEGAEGGTTAYGKRSTAAVCEDATTNKNMATENIMQEDGHGNFEDASEKMDGKEKILDSHVDLHAIGDDQRKPTDNADRQFLVASKGLDTEKQPANTNRRQKIMSFILLGRKKI
ncbi:Tau-tubulin kinase 1 [Taenia crassiceps]|uniref:non-specific serine/threonine protein kinase n=1 Tax=Taenia crassiceps TaxID=6207 RepID=A0ABR4PZZ8_9CEST